MQEPSVTLRPRSSQPMASNCGRRKSPSCAIEAPAKEKFKRSLFKIYTVLSVVREQILRGNGPLQSSTLAGPNGKQTASSFQRLPWTCPVIGPEPPAQLQVGNHLSHEGCNAGISPLAGFGQPIHHKQAGHRLLWNRQSGPSGSTNIHNVQEDLQHRGQAAVRERSSAHTSLAPM